MTKTSFVGSSNLWQKGINIYYVSCAYLIRSLSKAFLDIPNELEKINDDLCRLKINPNAMDCESINSETISNSNSMPIRRFDQFSIEEEEDTQKSKLLINPLKRTRNEDSQPTNSWLKQLKMQWLCLRCLVETICLYIYVISMVKAYLLSFFFTSSFEKIDWIIRVKRWFKFCTL